MILNSNFTHNGKKVHTHMTFSSISDFTDYIKSNDHGIGLESKDSNFSFRGTRNFAEALKLADEGWSEGLKKASELMASIEPNIFSHMKQRSPEYAFAGGQPDVGVYLTGPP